MSAVKEYCQSVFRSCCSARLCRPNTKYRLFAQARDRLSEEMDLVSLLRQLRYLEQAVNSLLRPGLVAKFKQDSFKLPLKPETYSFSSSFEYDRG